MFLAFIQPQTPKPEAIYTIEPKTPTLTSATNNTNMLSAQDPSSTNNIDALTPSKAVAFNKLNIFDDEDWDAPAKEPEALPEPLLVSNNKRFVLFPIQYHDVSVHLVFLLHMKRNGQVDLIHVYCCCRYGLHTRTQNRVSGVLKKLNCPMISMVFIYLFCLPEMMTRL
jgi:hypothetical protein